ncbi:unnamed protein product [Closterium sp. Yama58-4]|nr:unnamed protein product [Closterium sp. Yama58-4]
MIHAAAPHFLWPFAVRYAAHQLNLWPHVSLPETSPTLCWTGNGGDASAFRVWGSCAFVRDSTAGKLFSCAIPYVFLGFPPDASGWQFYHPTSRRVFPSQDVTLDEPIPFYRLFPYRTAPLPPPPPRRSSSLQPVEVTGDSGAAGGGAARGAEPGGAEPGGAASGGAEPGGAELGGAEPGALLELGALGLEALRLEALELEALELEVLELEALELETLELEALELEALALEALELETLKLEALELEALTVEALEPETLELEALKLALLELAVQALEELELESLCSSDCSSSRRRTCLSFRLSRSSTKFLVFLRPLPFLLTRRCLPRLVTLSSRSPLQSVVSQQSSRPASPVRAVRTARRVPRPRPPPVPGTHTMALRPSSAPQHVPLPSPPTSSLPELPDHETDRLRAASPTVTRLLATVVTDPSFESTAASALVAELVDFAAACRLDYAASLVAESASVCPPFVGGECALRTDVLEDRHEDFESLAAAVPHLVAWLLAPEGDPDALDIPTQRGQRRLRGSLHEEIWLRRPPGFTRSFPPGTQWSLRRPVYGLRQAPREWHDTLRTTLAALGFAPSTADPSLFLRTDTSLPPFYILVYVDDLVFATTDTEALALVKSKLQKRHTCTDLGELRSYLGLQITRDRARRTITLTQ